MELMLMAQKNNIKLYSEFGECEHITAPLIELYFIFY